jgi:hypothetical protein
VTAPIRGWHFAAEKLRDGNPLPKAGDVLRVEGKIVPCERGLHASVEPNPKEEQ